MNHIVQPKSKAAVVCSLLSRTVGPDAWGEPSFTGEESAKELKRLAHTLGMDVAATIFQERPAPDPATYLGKGKVGEVAEYVSDNEISYVLIDGELSPNQSKNLEDAMGVKVLDRTQLILEIFAQRAKTKEGKLQVELAIRRHELSRLTGRGTAMSSLGGGIGTRGPGEQRLEVDRRVLRKRISRLTRALEKAGRVRSEQRKRRLGSQIPRVSLVGYTNAGKSTLFTALTGENVLCDDMLFATLDLWTRKWILPSKMAVLLSDTVGFIQGLPHELVYAFRSTLEESLDADLLIHVVDASSPVITQQIKTVETVLEELGASECPIITVFNKEDVAAAEGSEISLGLPSPALRISALKGVGLSELSRLVERQLFVDTQVVSLLIPYSMWDILSEIREAGLILDEIHEDLGTMITCRLTPADVERFSRMLPG